MKSVLSEIIKIELVKSLLSEGRVEDAKAKYPQDTEVVDYFVSQDPAGNNKYLPWMMKTYKQVPTDAPEGVKQQAKELISQLIKGFHQHSPRLEKKDINQYKTLAELNSAVSPLIKASEEKAVKKEKEEAGVKKYYEDNDWLLLQPLTYESSCKYGANTKWCIASRDTSSHFKSYTKTGLLVFLIHKKSNHKFAFYTDEADETYIEIYNPLDSDIAGSGDLSVKEFLQGLVNGEMGDYLEIDEEGYGEDDEIEFFKIKEDGTTKKVFEDYDEDDFIYQAIDIIWSYFFRKGTGKNTIGKYVDTLKLFGFTLTVEKKRGEEDSWVISENGSMIRRGNNVKRYLQDDIVEDLIFDEVASNWTLSDLSEFIKNNNLPFRIGSTNSLGSQNSDYNNVMSEEQAKAIYNKYTELRKSYEDEKRKKDAEIIDNLVNRVRLSKEHFEVVKNCLNGRTAQQFDQCIYSSIRNNSYHLPIGLVNPKSGRTLKRKVIDVWRIFQSEVGNGDYNRFVYDLFNRIVNSPNVGQYLMKTKKNP
jgi:hypothetical protein